ncbi:DUF2384 domain-containing protein [soil metagenome]
MKSRNDRLEEPAALYLAGGLSALTGRGGAGVEEAVGLLRKGLPMTLFEGLRERLGVTAARLAKPMHLAPRTLARRKQEGRLQSAESDRLFRIARLFDLAETLMAGDRDKARRWFTTPKRALGGSSPLDYLDTEPGAREVEDLVGRLEHGVFS